MDTTHKWTAVLLACLIISACTPIRTDIIKPALNEEIAWNKMLKEWSIKAYASRDFRTGFIAAATKPFSGQLPGSLNIIIQDLVKAGQPDTEDYKAGAFGGATLAMYGIATGEGIRWLFNQLGNLGMLSPGILAGIVGL